MNGPSQYKFNKELPFTPPLPHRSPLPCLNNASAAASCLAGPAGSLCTLSIIVPWNLCPTRTARSRQASPHPVLQAPSSSIPSRVRATRQPVVLIAMPGIVLLRYGTESLACASGAPGSYCTAVSRLSGCCCDLPFRIVIPWGLVPSHTPHTWRLKSILHASMRHNDILSYQLCAALTQSWWLCGRCWPLRPVRGPVARASIRALRLKYKNTFSIYLYIDRDH